jgi:hypothetical protein
MPKKATKIVHADGETIILETTIGTDYRLSIPKAIQHQLKPMEKVQVTFKKIKEVINQ